MEHENSNKTLTNFHHLQAQSDVYRVCHPRALFTTTLHSREQSDVLISGVRSEILLLLIEYAYLRRIDVTDANVHELLMTADFLAFLGVLQLCCDHLRTSLSPKNCLGIMTFARFAMLSIP